MKKGTKKFLFLSVATLAGIYAYNQRGRTGKSGKLFFHS